MKLILGRRGDYAVRAMLDIAHHADGTLRKARHIAAQMDIPHRFLTQILAQLVETGFVEAKAGPTGGYRLARPAADISLLAIVEAAEGAVALDRCVLQGGPCEWVDHCPVHDTWHEAQEAFKRHLAATSFADLVEIDRAVRQGEHQPVFPIHDQETPRRGKPGRS